MTARQMLFHSEFLYIGGLDYIFLHDNGRRGFTRQFSRIPIFPSSDCVYFKRSITKPHNMLSSPITRLAIVGGWNKSWYKKQRLIKRVSYWTEIRFTNVACWLSAIWLAHSLTYFLHRGQSREPHVTSDCGTWRLPKFNFPRLIKIDDVINIVLLSCQPKNIHIGLKTLELTSTPLQCFYIRVDSCEIRHAFARIAVSVPWDFSEEFDESCDYHGGMEYAEIWDVCCGHCKDPSFAAPGLSIVVRENAVSKPNSDNNLTPTVFRFRE